MTCTLHQPVAGLDVGAEYTGPLEAFLVVSGYASDGSKTDKVNVTGVLPEDDATLAENREEPGTPFAIKGKQTKDAEKPVENGQRAPKAPAKLRNRTIGGSEQPEVAEQTAALDASDVEVAEEQPEAVEEASENEPVGNTVENEPTDAVEPPPAADAPPATKGKRKE